jgi:hypothetical protein
VSNDSKKSVDEESKVLLVTTPKTWMAKKALKTLDNNNGVQRSTWIKYFVQIFRYDGFVTYHYTYIVKVI